VLAATIAAFACPKGAEAAPPPWRAAEEIRSTLFEAQSALLLDDGAGTALRPAEQALDGRLDRDLERVAPQDLRELRAALAAAGRAFAACAGARSR
jgi:hypothetical protein